QRRGDQPVAECPVARLGDVAGAQRHEPGATEHLAEPLGGGQPKLEPGRLARRCRPGQPQGPRGESDAAAPSVCGTRQPARIVSCGQPPGAPPESPISAAIRLSAAMRFSVAGWVEKRLSPGAPESGLMM